MIVAFWYCIGFVGQALFGFRFITQWIASERAKRSVIPPMFWYVSVPAGVLVLAYAIWRQDPVFIVNEAVCLFIFIRNILMILKSKKDIPSADAEQPL